jgi:hypothetical protein
VSNAWSPINQRPKVVFSARDSNVFKQITACIHHSNDNAGQILTKRECSRH